MGNKSSIHSKNKSIYPYGKEKETSKKTKKSKKTCSCNPWKKKKSKYKIFQEEINHENVDNNCKSETKRANIENHNSMNKEVYEEIIETKATLENQEKLEKYSSDSDYDAISSQNKKRKADSPSRNENSKIICKSSFRPEEIKNKNIQLRRNFFSEFYEHDLNESKSNLGVCKISERSSMPVDNDNLYSEINKEHGHRASTHVKVIFVEEFENDKRGAMKIDKPENFTDQSIEKVREKEVKDEFESYFRFKNELFLNQIANKYIDKYMCGRGNDKNLPIGFANPSGYCYLNSVVQVIVSCQDFIKDLEAYDKWDAGETNDDTFFVRGIFDLIRALKKREHKSAACALETVQIYITESSFGDDVYKCFMNLLSRVSNVVKQGVTNIEPVSQIKPVTSEEKANSNFKRFEKRNPGFVFNNFYGQITFQTICKFCNKICNESFQMIKSLPLPVSKTEKSVTLNDCINLFLDESDVEVDDPMKCDCLEPTMQLKSVTKITHAPKYLFMYLNRGSYNEDGEKNETTVTCDHTIKIETTTGLKEYNLISVIDHMGNSSYGHYYCKCNYETYNWCLLNDTQVDLISNKEVITKQAIVFLFKQL